MENNDNRHIDEVNDNNTTQNQSQNENYFGQQQFVANTQKNTEGTIDNSQNPSSNENDFFKGASSENGNQIPFGQDNQFNANGQNNGFPQSEQNYYNGYTGGYYDGQQGLNESFPGDRKGFGIASMVLGIVSVVCCCIDGLPILLAILAIIFAALRMKIKSDGFAIAGLVLGIVGVLFNGLMVFLLMTGIADMYIEQIESTMQAIRTIGNQIFRK